MAVAPPLQISRHASDTAWWEMAQAQPSVDLAPHIGGLLGYVEQHPGVLRRREVPFAGVPVILGYGDSPYEILTEGSPTPRVVSSAFMAGMHDAPSITAQQGLQQGVQLDLTPLGAYQLFGVPMHELTNLVVPLDDLLGAEGIRLVDQLATSPDWSTRFAYVEQFLRRRLDGAPAIDPAVAWAWRQLEHSAGAVRVADLADEIGWSRRHFAKRFTMHVGLPPKATGRVLRFRRATELLRMPAEPGHESRTLADVAARCGYSDHSHFVREFRSLAGCTPSQYLAAALPEDGGVTA